MKYLILIKDIIGISLAYVGFAILSKEAGQVVADQINKQIIQKQTVIGHRWAMQRLANGDLVKICIRCLKNNNEVGENTPCTE